MIKKTAIKPVEVASIGTDMEEMEQIIRERAYLKFLEREGRPGDPLQDWLAAERALITRPSVSFADEERAFIAELDVAGVSAKDIQLKTDGAFVLVRVPWSRGERESNESQASPKLFCAIQFPRQIAKDAVRGEYRQGKLRIIGSYQDLGGPFEMTA